MLKQRKPFDAAYLGDNGALKTELSSEANLGSLLSDSTRLLHAMTETEESGIVRVPSQVALLPGESGLD